MNYDAKLANIITRLKEVKENNPELTLQKISDHTGVSFSTVSRIFADGSESSSFRYESVKPIAKMLLGLDSLDEGNDDELALKAIIQFKETAIEQLKKEINDLKEKHERKLEKERAQYRTSIDFLKHQIELKDARMDYLFEALENRRIQYEELYKLYVEATKK